MFKNVVKICKTVKKTTYNNISFKKEKILYLHLCDFMLNKIPVSYLKIKEQKHFYRLKSLIKT